MFLLVPAHPGKKVVCVCVCMRACVRACVHACVHACVLYYYLVTLLGCMISGLI